MGTTRIKVIDLSSDEKQIKTARKHAQKIAGAAKKEAKTKEPEKPQYSNKSEKSEKPEDQKIRVSESSDISEPPTIRPSESLESSEPSQPSKPSKPSAQKHHLGKKYQKASKLIEKGKIYQASEAIDLLYKTSTTKFDPTVEVHLNVADKNIKGSVNFPHQIEVKKKEKKILVFIDHPKALDDKRVILGNEKTIDEIFEGKLKPNRDFDAVFATSKFMPHLVKVAKILGPTGLMPNPKSGTVIEKIEDALKTKEEPGLEYKTDPTAPVVHTVIGKLSFKPDQLNQNLKTLVSTIGQTKIKKATITTTMGPPVKVDISSFL